MKRETSLSLIGNHGLKVFSENDAMERDLWSPNFTLG